MKQVETICRDMRCIRNSPIQMTLITSTHSVESQQCMTVGVLNNSGLFAQTVLINRQLVLPDATLHIPFLGNSFLPPACRKR